MTNPILPLLLALSAAATQEVFAQEVEGLRRGESFALLAPGPGPSADYAHGRVVDAFTGLPLAGATVELWSEEIDVNYGGFHRFGAATTGRDGRFLVREREGANLAEKLRVSAPGYLTFTEARGAIFDTITLFPAEQQAPRLRIVDLQERPIQGARVTSTFTCAHDIPAFEYTSDVNGIVVLRGYGLQDAIPELRVLAPGFAGIKYLDGEPILIAAARDEEHTLRLRRTPGAELKLFDEVGEPLMNTVVMVHDGDGHHVVRTNDQGACAIPARYGADDLVVQRLTPDPGPGAYGHGQNLRLAGWDWPADMPTARVRLVLEDAPEGVTTEGLEVTIWREGWTDSADEGGWVELPMPQGEDDQARVTAAITQSTGTRRGVASDSTPILLKNVGPERPATLGSANPVMIRLPLLIVFERGVDREVSVPWQRAVRATTVPAGLATSVVVEQGERSHEISLDEKEDTPIWITEDGPFTLWFPEYDLIVAGDRVFDAAETAALADQLTSARERANTPRVRAETRLRVPAETEVSAVSPSGSEVVLQADDREVVIEGPQGPVLLTFQRAGHVTRWARSLLGVSADASTPELPALASLRFTSDQGWQIEGVSSRKDLKALHPGPFDCVVRLTDGRRLGFALQLSPGEERVLRIVD